MHLTEGVNFERPLCNVKNVVRQTKSNDFDKLRSKEVWANKRGKIIGRGGKEEEGKIEEEEKSWR